MLEALIAVCCVLQVVFAVNLLRLLFRSQRTSAKIWLAFSAAFLLVCISGIAFIAIRESNQKAIALGFESGSDLQNAEKAGVNDPAAWRARKVEMEGVAAKQRAANERKAAAAKAIADTKEKADAERRAAEERLAAWRQENCDKYLDCIGKKKSAVANAYCSMVVERLAKYQSEWTDGWAEKKFPYFRWGNQEGVVTYYGGTVKFQNGFGAWENMIYECDFDIRRDQPIDARAQAGRLR